MIAFARLARISHERNQASGRDRFLVLTGREACRAGWLDVAARCRELVLASNPHHFLSHSESFPEALRDESCRRFLDRLDRFCSFEHAEHLLTQNNERLQLTEAGEPDDQVGKKALDELAAVSNPPGE